MFSPIQFEKVSLILFCLQILTVTSVIVSHNPEYIHFFLFSNRSDFDECHELPLDSFPHISSGFVPLVGTRFIIHGFADTISNNRTMAAIKNAYLDSHLPGNTIMVGWGKLAASDLLDQSPFPSNTEVEVAYRKSTQNLGIVGEKVAKFILNYMKMGLLRPDLIHLIGHSLGCHISGYIGTRVSTVAGFPIARITGLDPALHVFQIPNFENKIFLGKDNASFVDVIHCNLGGYGVNWNCGDVDFYPNGGRLQPGCPPLAPQSGNNSACSHSFCITLYAASVNNPLMSCRCPLVVGAGLFQCMNPVPMGLYCPPYARHEYCLQTPRNPFSIGKRFVENNWTQFDELFNESFEKV